MHFCLESDIIVKVFRGVAQVVERYFREVEAAGSSPVIPIRIKSSLTKWLLFIYSFFVFLKNFFIFS